MFSGFTVRYKPIRSKTSSKAKWAVSYEMYPQSYYPDFIPGSSYFITMDIVKELLSSAEFLPYLSRDDVFVTGILAKVVGLNLIGLKKYRLDLRSNMLTVKQIACRLLNNQFIETFFPGKIFTENVWKVLQSGRNNVCSDEKPGSKYNFHHMMAPQSSKNTHHLQIYHQ